MGKSEEEAEVVVVRWSPGRSGDAEVVVVRWSPGRSGDASSIWARRWSSTKLEESITKWVLYEEMGGYKRPKAHV